MVVKRSWCSCTAELGAVAELLALLLGGSIDVDPGTVHVHFAVADLVEPSPGEESGAGRCVAGNGEVVVRSQRAGTDHALDDAEGLAVVVGERELARTAEVTGTAYDCDVVCGASFEGSGGADRSLSVVSFAREVASVCFKRVGVRVVLEIVRCERVVLAVNGQRIVHLHMSNGGSHKGEAGNEDVLESHVVDVV